MLWWMLRGKRQSFSQAKEISGMPHPFKTSVHPSDGLYMIKKFAGKLSLACRVVPGWREMWRLLYHMGNPSQLDMLSRWDGRMCTRYLEWFQSGTLRGSLKFASLTPMRGFRYSFLESTNALDYFPPRSKLTSWCVKASLDISSSANFTTTRSIMILRRRKNSNRAMSRWKMPAWMTSRNLPLLNALLLLSTVCLRGLTSTSRLTFPFLNLACCDKYLIQVMAVATSMMKTLAMG